MAAEKSDKAAHYRVLRSIRITVSPWPTRQRLICIRVRRPRRLSANAKRICAQLAVIRLRCRLRCR